MKMKEIANRVFWGIVSMVFAAAALGVVVATMSHEISWSLAFYISCISLDVLVLLNGAWMVYKGFKELCDTVDAARESIGLLYQKGLNTKNKETVEGVNAEQGDK